MNKPVLLSAQMQLTATQRRNIGVGVYVKREREKNEALGQQVSKMAGVYVPEAGYYRNDGHINIKSRGVQC